MRFMTGLVNRKYTVMPNPHPTDAVGNPLRTVPGLRIRSDRNGIIDTDEAQARNGWTDEQRLAVERHLIAHRDFGMRKNVDSGIQQGDDLLNKVVPRLWFAPGQGIPDEHREFIERQAWYVAWSSADLPVLEAVGEGPPEAAVSERVCLGRISNGASVSACRNPALEGEDYCSLHLEREVASV